MKKIFFSLILMIPIILFAQDRINKPLPKLSLPLSTLSWAKGWSYSIKDGQWSGFNKSILGFDEFIKFEFRNIALSEQKYLTFLKYYTHGHSEYPELGIGWIEYTKIDYYIIDKSEFQNQIMISDSTTMIKIKILKRGDVLPEYIKTIPNESISIFNEQKKSSSEEEYLVILYKLLKDKKKARFVVYMERWFKDLCIYTGYNGGAYDDRIKQQLKSGKILNEKYYEISMNTFLNFINLKKSK